MNKILTQVLTGLLLTLPVVSEEGEAVAVQARTLRGAPAQGPLQAAGPQSWKIGGAEIARTDLLSVAFPPAPETAGAPPCWLYTTGGDRLAGQIKGIEKKNSKDYMLFETSLGVPVSIDFASVKAAVFPAALNAFPNRIRAEIEETLFSEKQDRKKDFYYFDLGEGRYDHEEEFIDPAALAARELERELPDKENPDQMVKRKVPLLGVRFFVVPDPDAPKPAPSPCLLATADGGVWNGAVQELKDGNLLFQPGFQKEAVPIPLSKIREIEFRTDKVVYLSDLDPAKIEHRPFLRDPKGKDERPWSSYLKDQPVTVSIPQKLPLRLKGKAYRKGVGVHSYCKLSYALNKQYDRFLSDVGIDDHVLLETENRTGAAGVVFRVVGDGKELYKSALLSPGMVPETVALDVANVDQLELIVEFGDKTEELVKNFAEYVQKQDLRQTDILDRADWAGALLIRKK